MQAMSLIGPEAQVKHTVGAQDLKLTTHTEQLAVSSVLFVRYRVAMKSPMTEEHGQN